MSPPVAHLGPLRVPLRRYQATLLEAVAVAEARGDAHFHLVAPSGAGKTLAGLEVVRRLGQPAVVFTPTAALTRRWCDEVERFADGPRAVAVLAGLVDAGVVDAGLRAAGVEVREHAGGAVEVGLPAGTAADGAAFVTAVREVLGPVREPRYLVAPGPVAAAP